MDSGFAGDEGIARPASGWSATLSVVRFFADCPPLSRDQGTRRVSAELDRPASCVSKDRRRKRAEFAVEKAKEIVDLVADAHSNREISEILHLSEHTLKNYMLRIFDKLGVSSRVELILYVITRPGSDRSNEKRRCLRVHQGNSSKNCAPDALGFWDRA